MKSDLPYDLLYIQSILKDDNVFMTAHVRQRCIQRGITYDDIVDAIINGVIIEEYPDDFPYPSCLIFGRSKRCLHIHVVLSSDKKNIFIITSYIPDPNEWEKDMKTRKRGELK